MSLSGLSVVELIGRAEALAGECDALCALYATWIEANAADPLLYAVLFNYSVILADKGDLEGAKACLERALSQNPDFAPAAINLGRMEERLGDNAQAVTCWSAAAERLGAVNGASVSHKVTLLNQMARVLEAGFQDEAAEAMLRQSLELDRGQPEVVSHILALRQRQCAWPVVAPWEHVPRRVLTDSMSPLSLAAYADDPILQLAAAWNYNRRDVGHPAGDETPPDWTAMVAGGEERLRIGYLSSDLREHAVGYLTAELFELHDREAVESFAYYCGPAGGDRLQERHRAAFAHWTDITGLDDRAAAARIRADGIHILVDLNGYTRDGRVKLLARRPAPVIVNWLGFPGTMGSPYHHYIIADEAIIPPAFEIYYSEAVRRLPCYQPNDRRRQVAEHAPSRAEAGLPEEAVVFCCFNGTHKINRFTFERWLRILAGVPGSVLWLLGGSEAAERRLCRLAEAAGIDPARLVFAAKLANPHHLARYPLADLFLDTWPYGAHTTASDALWMGVPVLTRWGRSFASRVCASLVRAAGLPEMACADAQSYEDRAIALGRDRAELRRLSDRLNWYRNKSVLFDMPGLVRHLEGLYRGMWEDFRQGRLPLPDLTNLEAYLEVGMGADHDGAEDAPAVDYRQWWRDRLASRHAWRPLAIDRRMWGAGG
ncbi:MAG: glycosyl transferase [Magnetospirillum sp.]|nr:glycosyl transferase [Magnetospirillum sp.]